MKIEGSSIAKLYMKAVKGDKEAFLVSKRYCHDDLEVTRNVLKKLFPHSQGEISRAPDLVLAFS